MKALLFLIEFGVVAVPIMLAIIGLASVGTSTVKPPAPRGSAEPHHAGLRPKEAKTLTFGMGLFAVFIALVLSSTAGGAWWLLPLAAWVVLFVVMRNWAQGRQHRRAELIPRTKQALGKDGVALMERSDAAVKRITTSVALRDGWLGEPDELDLQGDLVTIADRMRRAVGVREVIAELSTLPKPTAEDVKRKADANRAAQRLEGDAQQRVSRLEDLAHAVTAIDSEIKLAELLSGVDLDDDARSHSAETLRAALAAYRDLNALPGGTKPAEPKPAEPKQAQPGGIDGLWRTVKQWWDE